MARRFAAVVFSLGCIQAGSAYALGLGDLKLESFLNEPLSAKAQLLNTGTLNEEQIRIRLATREDFERMGVDRAYFLTQIKFDIEIDEQGQGVIHLSSEDPVLEPYLDFIIEARWPTGRLLREYTILVDPPLFDSTTRVVSASARVAEVEGTPDPQAAGKKSQAASATSGTRVDVSGKSQLGPGDMPQRDFNADTTDTPIPGQRYMIHRDDTLWEIASAATPSGTTVHQTMLDIQRINPEAFIDGNINRIKAGYIIYMPNEGDISSSDLSAALAEVRQQNEDWEAGRASKPIASGPALRISADPVPGQSAAASQSAEDYAAAGSAGGEEADKAALQQAEQSEQIAAMQQQVDTLQRIVNLKDDQIAALQAALAEAGGESPSVEGESISGDRVLTDLDALEAAGQEITEEAGEAEAAAAEALEEQAAPTQPEPAEAEEVAAAPAPQSQPAAPAAPAASADSGMMSYLFYGLGALVLAVLAFLFMRRRNPEEGAAVAAPSPKDDQVFATVDLKEQPVEAPEEPEVAQRSEPEQEPALEEVPDGDRGYGARKHDEYASDVDAGDALAEADIYIAYGRYPQAIDMLRGAISSEPSNPSYRLKMLELLLQTGDRSAAESEMRELEAIGDAASIESGRELLSGAGAGVAGSVDLSEPPAGLAEEVGGSLESNFADLEIEDTLGDGEEVADDLDLSADFSDSLESADDEDLVIAAEANGMSTKLDLARAYLDMGDEDGARQILEEVMAEGSDEQKSEAGELLERIG